MPNDIYIKYLPVVDSTNNYLRCAREELFSEAGDARIVAVYAGEQTAGRGQRGNVWCSAGNENLLLSLLLRPGVVAVKEQFLLSQVMALAVNEAMCALGVDSVIKWPNDIYVGKRKLAGILVELDYAGDMIESAIVGVGVNVNQTLFPVMDKIPVSLSLLTGQRYDVRAVLDVFLASFVSYYGMLEGGEVEKIVAEYKKHLLGYGTSMRYKDASSVFDAVISDVQGDGALCLKREGGVLSRYYFKEVELLL